MESPFVHAVQDLREEMKGTSQELQTVASRLLALENGSKTQQVSKAVKSAVTYVMSIMNLSIVGDQYADGRGVVTWSDETEFLWSGSEDEGTSAALDYIAMQLRKREVLATRDPTIRSQKDVDFEVVDFHKSDVLNQSLELERYSNWKGSVDGAVVPKGHRYDVLSVRVLIELKKKPKKGELQWPPHHRQAILQLVLASRLSCYTPVLFLTDLTTFHVLSFGWEEGRLQLLLDRNVPKHKALDYMAWLLRREKASIATFAPAEGKITPQDRSPDGSRRARPRKGDVSSTPAGPTDQASTTAPGSQTQSGANKSDNPVAESLGLFVKAAFPFSDPFEGFDEQVAICEDMDEAEAHRHYWQTANAWFPVPAFS